MRRLARTTALLTMAGLMMIGVGCVPQDRYDQLLMTNRSLQEQLAQAEGDRDTSRANLETVRRQLNRATENLSELQSQNSRLSRDLEDMARDYDELLRRVSDLEIGPLPAEVETAIEQLAERYPDVLTFDARRGLLRFASDFTFDLGSVELKSDAVRTLEELGEILNREHARNFEIRIVGHTDDVPIGRPETRQRHPTNVHLSVHRAISVRDKLDASGVDPVRMQVAGYGEHRPRVPNRPGGTAENRRVEIFLLPMPEDITPEQRDASPREESRPSGAQAPQPEPMK